MVYRGRSGAGPEKKGEDVFPSRCAVVALPKPTILNNTGAPPYRVYPAHLERRGLVRTRRIRPFSGYDPSRAPKKRDAKNQHLFWFFGHRRCPKPKCWLLALGRGYSPRSCYHDPMVLWVPGAHSTWTKRFWDTHSGTPKTHLTERHLRPFFLVPPPTCPYRPLISYKIGQMPTVTRGG